MTPALDWPALMRLGFGQLGLGPEQFWALTPVEFISALEGAGLWPVAALDRAGLEALMAAYPDGAKEEPHHG
ncbi:MAG: rcc01693 family protein [Pseudomonadota bacterium]